MCVWCGNDEHVVHPVRRGLSTNQLADTLALGRREISFRERQEARLRNVVVGYCYWKWKNTNFKAIGAICWVVEVLKSVCMSMFVTSR